MKGLQWLSKIFQRKSVVHLPPTEAYDLLASHYDNQGFNAVEAFADELQREFLTSLKHQKTVLDFGCGTGRNIPILKTMVNEVIGLDASPNMLAQLKQKYPEVKTFCTTEDGGMPFKQNTFDLIFCTLTLGYVKQTQLLFHEWNRVLKPGGHIILIDLHPTLNQEGKSRNFKKGNKKIVIDSQAHSKEQLDSHFIPLGWRIKNYKERVITTQDVVKYKDEVNLGSFLNTPIVYGFLLEKE